MKRKLRLAAFLAVLGSPQCGAVIHRGRTVVEAGSVQFLAKFCVGQGGQGEFVGHAAVKLKVLSGAKDVKVAIFDDEDNSYPWKHESEAWNKMTCDDKVNKARGTQGVSEASREIDLTGRFRPRWWFFAIADCSKEGRSEVEYELHLQNTLKGWEKEVSEDQRGLQYVFGPAFVAYVFLAAAQLYANGHYWARLTDGQAEALHPLVRFLTTGILFTIATTIIAIIQQMY